MGTTGQPQGTPRPAIAPAHPQGLRPPVQGQPAIRQPMGAPAHQPQPPRPAGAAAPRPASDDAIALVEELTEVEGGAISSAPAPASKIKFGPDISHKKHEWKRKPHVTGSGACRMKSFHAKYSDQGLEHLDDAVNEWLDEHTEVEVKFVTTTVHVFEGKIREPAIVMNVWY